MIKRVVSIWICLLMVTSAFMAVDLTEDIVSNIGGGTVNVFPGPGTPLQNGIDSATNGETVIVHVGIYYEEVIVNKTINLTGEDRNLTMINGTGSGDVVYVTANWVNITGFTISNGSSGVHLFNSSNNTITDCNIFSNTGNGIHIDEGSNGTNIIGCDISSNQENGIEIESGCYNVIRSCNVSFNEDGISMSGFFVDTNNNSIISCNVFSNNGSGISLFFGASDNTISYCNIFSNNGSGVAIAFIAGENNITGCNITNNGAGIAMAMWAFYNSITKCNISDNMFGIIMLAAFVNTITSCDISSNNLFGIALAGSMANIVTSCNITSNNMSGIIMAGSSEDPCEYNGIMSCNISNHQMGVMLGNRSSNNWIVGCNISSNQMMGMLIENYSSNNTILGCDISSSQMMGIMLVNYSSNNMIINSSIKTSGLYDFSINNASNITALNTTFDVNKVSINNTSNLTVQWYMHVKVEDDVGGPVAGATIWVNDTYGTNVDTRTTGLDGWAKWIIVTERIQNSTTNTTFTPHKVTATDGVSIGNAVPDPYMDRSMDVIVILGSPGFAIDLKKGWNMISLPLNQSTTDLESILASVDYIAVLCYNSSDMNDHWKNYHKDKESLNLNDLSDIDKTMGIWILMASDDTLIVTGDQPSPTNIPLKKGWNFVGYPSLTPKLLVNALSSISGKYDTVYHYNASASSWEGSITGTLTMMRPGEGYWIHVNEDCIWEIDN